MSDTKKTDMKNWTMRGTDVYTFKAFCNENGDRIYIKKELKTPQDPNPKVLAFVRFGWECSEELIDTLDELRKLHGKIESKTIEIDTMPKLCIMIREKGAVQLTQVQSGKDGNQVLRGFVVKNQDLSKFIEALKCASRRTYGPETLKMYQRIGELTTAGLSPTEALAWTVCKRDPPGTEEERILWTRRLGHQLSGPELRSMCSRAKVKVKKYGV